MGGSSSGARLSLSTSFIVVADDNLAAPIFQYRARLPVQRHHHQVQDQRAGQRGLRRGIPAQAQLKQQDRMQAATIISSFSVFNLSKHLFFLSSFFLFLG